MKGMAVVLSGALLVAVSLHSNAQGQLDWGKPEPPIATQGMTKIAQLKHPSGRVGGWIDRMVAFDPDARLLAAAGGGLANPNAICVWRLADRRLVSRVSCGRGNEVRFVLLSRAGKRLACGGDSAAWVVDVASGRRLVTVSRPCAALWLSDDGKSMRMVSEAGIWYECRQGRGLARRVVRGARMDWGIFSRDGERMVALRSVGPGRLRDGDLLVLKRGRPSCRTFRRVMTDARFQKFDANPAAHCAMVAEWWSAEVSVFDTRSGKRLREFPIRTPHGMALSPDGSRLAMGASGGLVVVDPTTGAARASAPIAGSAGAISWSRDGHFLAAAGDDGIVVWRVRQ